MQELNFIVEFISSTLDTMTFLYIMKFLFCSEININKKVWIWCGVSQPFINIIEKIMFHGEESLILFVMFPMIIVFLSYGIIGLKKIIYSCIVAPIIEECIYRGAVLRSLEKYGRGFSILASAILFGLMHGNFYQIFMATIVGIILGYLAMEYSIKLTIILHILNNTGVQIFSDISSHISENAQNIFSIIILIISTIMLTMALIYYKNNIKEWLQNNRIEKGMILRFFTSIPIILVITFDLFMVVNDITRVL